jgi:rhodanese-related sulfurtransferase
MGYEDVANLEGGLTAWKEVGLSTVDHHALI